MAYWYEAMRPNKMEQARLQVASFLLPIAISGTRSVTQSNKNFISALQEAQKTYLSNYADGQEIVDVGDYIVWDIERDSFARILRNKFYQPVTTEMLSGHKLRMSMLLEVAAEVRKELAVADLEIAIINSSNASPDQIFVSVAKMMAATISKQILGLNVQNNDFSQDEIARFNKSVNSALMWMMTMNKVINQKIRP